MTKTTLQSTSQTILSPLGRLKSKAIFIRQTRFKPIDLAKQYTQSTLLSHFLTALSSSFPDGERFFVETIRNVRDQIQDASLQTDISAFIGQESMHAHAHEQFNQHIQSSSYHLKRFDAASRQEMIRLRTLSPRRQLAATVALEHFTAMIAGYMLTHPRLIQQLPSNMASLWIWHAVEEIEHKHVAFDVYQRVFNNLAQRRRSMRTITIGFLTSTTVMTTYLLWQDRQHSLGSFRQLWQNLKGMGFLAHMVISLLPDYFSFYKKDFHPSDIDQTALLEHWRQQLLTNNLVDTNHRSNTA